MKFNTVRFLFLAFPALAILGNSCSFPDNKKDTIISVEPEFSIDLVEILGEPSQLAFQLTTLDPYDCLNDSINFFVQRFSKEIHLSINSITKAPNCIPGRGYLQSNARVGATANDVYSLGIDLKSAIYNQGKLYVNDRSFRVSMKENDGFELVRTELNRVPARLVWGYLGYRETKDIGDLAQELMDEFSSTGRPVVLTEGSYTPFDVVEGQVLKLHEPPPFPYFKTFFFLTDGDLSQVQNLLDGFRHDYDPDQVAVQLFTWKGGTL